MKRAKQVLLWVMGVGYILAGLNHFRTPETYIGMMPPYLPWHEALVALSGVFEILGGIGVLLPRTRRWAAWGLIGLLLAVFPANLHMALHEVPLGDSLPPRWAVWARLPFQLLFLVWAYWYTRPEPDGPGPGRGEEGPSASPSA